MPPSTQHAELNTSEVLLAQNEEAEPGERDGKHRSMCIGKKRKWKGGWKVRMEMGEREMRSQRKSGMEGGIYVLGVLTFKKKKKSKGRAERGQPCQK